MRRRLVLNRARLDHALGQRLKDGLPAQAKPSMGLQSVTRRWADGAVVFGSLRPTIRLQLKAAYTRFGRRLSSSSAFIWPMMDGSIAPYFAIRG